MFNVFRNGIGTEFVKTHGRQSSVDDMLNELDDLSLGGGAAPDATDNASSAIGTAAKTAAPLQPKVMTASDLAEQQRSARASEDIVRASVDDPFADAANLDRLKREYEDLQALVDSFSKDKTRYLYKFWLCYLCLV